MILAAERSGFGALARPLPPVAAPLGIIVSMGVAAWGWNQEVGLSWTPSPALILVFPAVCLAIGWVYAYLRPAPLLSEIATYAGLWIAFPVFGTMLSYLCVTLGHPLADPLLAQADRALGFHWLDWCRFVARHPWFHRILSTAYLMPFWQPLASVVLFAWLGADGRNQDFLNTILVALLLTLAISAFLPAIGPAASYRLKPRPEAIIRALRAHTTAPLAYVGIISFPSFHTVMAILFTYAHRGIRRTFPLFLALNAVMLVAVPFAGDHYLTDMIGGAVVAMTAIILVRWLSPRHARPSARGVEAHVDDPLPAG